MRGGDFGLSRKRLKKRLKSFCVAKPMQKLLSRWTECGWSRGFSCGLWTFQVGLALWRRRRGTSRGLRRAPWSPLRRSRRRVHRRQPSFRAHKPEDWRRRAKCVRGMPDACKDNLELVSGEGVGGSWSLGPLRRNLADKQEKAFAAARTDPRTVRLFRVGGRIGGFRAHWGLSRCRLRVEAKQ